MKGLPSHASLWLLLLNMCGPAPAQSGDPWLHLKVRENKTAGSGCDRLTAPPRSLGTHGGQSARRVCGAAKQFRVA